MNARKGWALWLAGCVLSVAAASPAAQSAKAAKAASTDLVYGFRHDPMAFVEKDVSLQGAAVRTMVFGKPRPGDEKVLEAHYRKVFAGQKPDGSLPDKWNQGVLSNTGERLLELLQLGYSPDRPEMQRAAGLLRREAAKLSGAKAADASCYAVHTMCLLGATDPPAVKATLLKLAARMDWFCRWGCPGTPEVQLKALWAGRKVANVGPAIDKGLGYTERHMSPTGVGKEFGLCDPWAIVSMVGLVDHPACARIAPKLVPMLLRHQRPDGGWGRHSLDAFRTLHKHGLLASLRKLPALPPDWRIVRSIPCPARKPWGLAWDGERFWTRDAAGDGKPSTLVAVSPKDGKALRRLELPAKPEFAWLGTWDGAPALTSPGRKVTVHRIDPVTGAIDRSVTLPGMENFVAGVGWRNGELLVGDSWNGGTLVLRPDDPNAKPRHIYAPANNPVSICAMPNGELWLMDVWAPAVVRTNDKGELLDWGEWPFARPAGIAHDGRHLWALDPKGKRICSIESNRKR